MKSKDQQTTHQLEISREEVRKLEQAQLDTMRVASELLAAQRELEELRPLRGQLRERERERAAESMNIEVHGCCWVRSDACVVQSIVHQQLEKQGRALMQER